MKEKKRKETEASNLSDRSVDGLLVVTTDLFLDIIADAFSDDIQEVLHLVGRQVELDGEIILTLADRDHFGLFGLGVFSRFVGFLFHFFMFLG